MRITKRALADLAKIPPPARQTVHWDDQITGYGVRVSPGGVITHILKYRVRGNPRQRFESLGRWPESNIDSVRELAAAIRAAALAGRDLVAERVAEAEADEQRRRDERRRAIPLLELLDAWRSETEASRSQKAARGESVLYETELLRLEAKILRPGLAADTIGTLDPDRFQALIHAQASVSTARNLRNLIVRFVRYARSQLTLKGIRVDWPVAFEVVGRPASRSDRFTLAEVARVWIAAEGMGRRGALLRWMLLTGCRRSEAAQAARSDLHLEDDGAAGPYWLQPGRATKNHKPHRVPLSAPAVALARWLPARPGSLLLFPGRGGARISSWSDVRAVLREKAHLETGVLHDFRRTIVSTLGDEGFDPMVADKLLNHAAAATSGGVMGVYQRSDLWARQRAAVDLWSNLLLAAVEAEQGHTLSRETWGFDAPFSEARLRRSGAPAPIKRRKRGEGRVKRLAAQQ